MKKETPTCPVTGDICEYYYYKHDHHIKIINRHCNHPDNKSRSQDNCTHEACPLVSESPNPIFQDGWRKNKMEPETDIIEQVYCENGYYAKRNIAQLDKDGGYYSRHISAMTSEKLHLKSDIAAELAYRDARIERLEEVLKEVSGCCEAHDRPVLCNGCLLIIHKVLAD